MRDTVWDSGMQKLVDNCGTARGMRAVLEEREVDTTGMKAKEMREALKHFPDFKETVYKSHRHVYSEHS